MFRTHKTKIISSSIFVIAVLITAGAISVIRYSCGLHDTCKTTAYNLQLTYPYGWRVSHYHSQVEKNSIAIVSPDADTVVGIGPQYDLKSASMTGGQLDDYFEVVNVQRMKYFPNSLDVRLINKMDLIEDGFVTNEGFASLESVMSVTQYNQLKLTTTGYALVPQNKQEFLFNPTNAETGGYLLLAVHQTPSTTESAAKEWFSQPLAKKAHMILLSVRHAT